MRQESERQPSSRSSFGRGKKGGKGRKGGCGWSGGYGGWSADGRVAGGRVQALAACGPIDKANRHRDTAAPLGLPRQGAPGRRGWRHSWTWSDCRARSVRSAFLHDCRSRAVVASSYTTAEQVRHAFSCGRRAGPRHANARGRAARKILFSFVIIRCRHHCSSRFKALQSGARLANLGRGPCLLASDRGDPCRAFLQSVRGLRAAG